MNSINELISSLVSAGLWIGASVLFLVIFAAIKFRPKKQPPVDDPPPR